MSADESFLFFLGIVLSAALFGGIGMSNHYGWQREIIVRGYAMHCPDDGRWAWIGECEK